MKLSILSANNKQVGTMSAPAQFNEPVRVDLIKRAVLAIQSNRRQPYGPNPEAGKNYAATLSKRRRKYRGGYGRGVARTPRKVMARRGTWFHYVGAIAPNTVGGRRAHPPQVDKDWKQKVNKKERKKAIRIFVESHVKSRKQLSEWKIAPIASHDKFHA